MKKMLSIIAPPLLILLYVYTAASKLADVPKFRGELYNQVFPHAVGDALLFLLPAAELVAVALLAFERTRVNGLWLSLLLLSLFTGYIGLALLGFWHEVPCSCGGVVSSMSWREHLLFNLFFLGINAAALAAEGYRGKAENP